MQPRDLLCQALNAHPGIAPSQDERKRGFPQAALSSTPASAMLPPITAMTTATSLSNAPDLSTDDYLVLGLATCFIKEDGEIHEVKVVEPIPSAALEAIARGIPTSYQSATATTIGAVLQGDTPQLPAGFPANTQFCDEFSDRAIAAARTYKNRAVAKDLVPLGTTRTDFNFSTERKRVLNSQRIVRVEDNVKQHEYTHKVL